MKRNRDFFQNDADSGQTLPRADEVLVAAIAEEAARRGIELTSDRDLLAALASIQGDEVIPDALYAAVAVALSWVDGLQGSAPEAGKKVG